MQERNIYLSISLVSLLISIVSAIVLLEDSIGTFRKYEFESLFRYYLISGFVSVLFGYKAGSYFSKSIYGCFIDAFVALAFVIYSLSALYVGIILFLTSIID